MLRRAVARRSHGDLNECTTGTHMITTLSGSVCTETSQSPWRRHCVSTVSSGPICSVCIAPTPNMIYSTAPSRRPHRVATAIIAFTWRPHGVLRHLQGADTAITQCCELPVPFTKENVIYTSHFYESVATISKFPKLIKIHFWIYV